jgi:hypothetical protein
MPAIIVHPVRIAPFQFVTQRIVLRVVDVFQVSSAPTLVQFILPVPRARIAPTMVAW